MSWRLRGFAASAAAAAFTTSFPSNSGADLDSQADAAEQARNITRAIKAAYSLQQLQQIVQQAGSHLNPIHAAAALNAAARLGRGGSALTTSTDAAALQDGSSSAEQGAAAAAAAAAPAEELVNLLLPGWLAILPQARPRELAGVLYASAKLHCSNEQLWSATVAAFMQPECVGQANAQDISTLAYALATAGTAQQPPAESAGAGIETTSSSSSSSVVPGLAVEQVQLAMQVLALQLAVLLSRAPPAAADCQSIVKVLWAHAKLGCAMGAQELLLLLQTLAQPSLLAVTDAQALANTLWAVSELQQLPAWQQQQQQQRQAAAASLQQVWLQLLGLPQLQRIAYGSPQAVANSLLALGRLASGGSGQHAIAVPFAQHCALQLLEGPSTPRLKGWSAHDVSTAMSACGKLGCRAMNFFHAAAAAAQQWLPHTTARDLAEVASACSRLRFKDEQLMADIMQHGRQLMHRTHGHGALLPSQQQERTYLAATLSGAVAALKMMQLAGDVKALIAAATIKQQEEPLSAADARLLWRVHGWLLHQSPNHPCPLALSEQVQLAMQVLALQLAVLLSRAPPAAADCQSIVKVLWAHAKLGCAMGAQELLLLLQTLAQPSLLAVTDAQALANTLWAVSELQQLPAWQQQQQQQRQAAAASLQQVWLQLLGLPQLQRIAYGSPQAVANSLLALGRLASGGSGQHAIAVPFAQHCALQLLEGPSTPRLKGWSAHDVSTAMSACGKLGCRAMNFFHAAAAAAQQWLPHTTARDLAEVASACSRLRFKDEQLMADIMQHGRQLMHRTHGHGALLPSQQQERTYLAATLSGAVAALKMMQLAGDVKALIAAATIKQQEEPLSAADARLLWRVHGWLLHEHPHAHGLAKLLTEEQLAACAEASRHTHRASPPAAVVAQLQQQWQQQ
eukprot:jgi/Sobl393_1/9653/SZX77258.1